MWMKVDVNVWYVERKNEPCQNTANVEQNRIIHNGNMYLLLAGLFGKLLAIISARLSDFATEPCARRRFKTMCFCCFHCNLDGKKQPFSVIFNFFESTRAFLKNSNVPLLYSVRFLCSFHAVTISGRTAFNCFLNCKTFSSSKHICELCISSTRILWKYVEIQICSWEMKLSCCKADLVSIHNN